jgi:hypothetical protein
MPYFHIARIIGSSHPGKEVVLQPAIADKLEAGLDDPLKPTWA